MLAKQGKYFIIGAGKFQYNFIKTANKMGLETHVFDKDKNAIGKEFAFKFYPISIFEKEEILKIAQKEKPVGIHAVANEQGNITACYVGENLGLISNSYETALNTTNKIKMKKICKIKNILTPIHYEFKNIDEIDLKRISLPVIVKPSDRSAGRGVKLVDDENQLEIAASEALEYSFDKKFIIEEYIDFDQYSLETITHNGRHDLVAITKMHFNGPPDFVENFHFMPPKINKNLFDKIKKFTSFVLDSFNILCGACHIEVRIDKDNKIYLIEIASRLGGWRDWMTEAAFSYNYCESIINTSLGEKYIDPTIKTKRKLSISRHILYEEDYIKYFNILKKYNDRIYVSLVEKKKPINTGAKNLVETDGPYILSINEEERDYFINYLN